MFLGTLLLSSVFFSPVTANFMKINSVTLICFWQEHLYLLPCQKVKKENTELQFQPASCFFCHLCSKILQLLPFPGSGHSTEPHQLNSSMVEKGINHFLPVSVAWNSRGFVLTGPSQKVGTRLWSPLQKNRYVSTAGWIRECGSALIQKLDSILVQGFTGSRGKFSTRKDMGGLVLVSAYVG